MDSVLVVEDTPTLSEVLGTVLRGHGFEVTSVGSYADAAQKLGTHDFSVILSDLRLPDRSGLEVVEHARSLEKKIPIVVMTAYGSIDIAVHALKLGASNFITKPFDTEALVKILREAVHGAEALSQKRKKRLNTKRLIYQSAAMEALMTQARRVAPLGSSVLILGESGVGKELVARFIHESSPRHSQEFVAVNCASMPADLLESEFFGHEPGAFTGASERRIGLFEVADGGTIFLDEIGTMPPALQAKLLRTLQESEIKRLGSNKLKKINIRVISATNCALDEEIRVGRFREDLFYRLGVIVLEVPPLRKRIEDIELLANYFIKTIAAEHSKNPNQLTPDGLALLQSYEWPGNIRELENVIERAVTFHDGPLSALSFELPRSGNSVQNSLQKKRCLREIAQAAVKAAEVEALLKTLNECGWNKSQAARTLGVSYKTLLNKLKEYQLEKSPADYDQPS